MDDCLGEEREFFSLLYADLTESRLDSTTLINLRPATSNDTSTLMDSVVKLSC
jgi:hypothetical protein